MKNQIFFLIGLTCITTAAVPISVVRAAKTAGTWLDVPLTNWNQPRGAIPKPPSPQGESPTTARCKDIVRKPTTPEDRAVSAAGWTLYGSYQLFSSTSVVSAMSSVDGMCRPLGYQEFVFVDGKFAGTLSPTPMNSRTDGALDKTYLFRASNLNAEFRRYLEKDPLCCPSRTSVVNYQLKRLQNMPVLVPISVTTNPNR